MSPGRVVQHNPISVASRALKNLSGGVQTNRDHVIQIECVGTSDRRNRESWGDLYVEDWTTAYKDGIKALMRWIEENAGVPRTCGVTFKAYPESYGDNGVRLTGPEWDAYSGWLGHQHGAEQLHGDPGLIDIAYLLDAPAPIPTPPSVSVEVDMATLTTVLLPITIDPDGNGWLDTPGIPWDKIVSVTPHGPNPPEQGYLPLARIGMQERDGGARVTVEGGWPEGASNVVVKYVS